MLRVWPAVIAGLLVTLSVLAVPRSGASLMPPSAAVEKVVRQFYWRYVQHLERGESPDALIKAHCSPRLQQELRATRAPATEYFLHTQDWMTDWAKLENIRATDITITGPKARCLLTLSQHRLAITLVWHDDRWVIDEVVKTTH